MKKKTEVAGLLIFVAVVLGLIVIYCIYDSRRAFSYENGLDQTVLTVNGTEITLREISYYVIEVENAGDEFAKEYNPDNPLEYWGLYMNEADRAGYVSDLARNAAMDYCIRDNIYYQEAVKAGVGLTDDEAGELHADAENYYYKMTARQREVTGLLPEELELILKKVTITQKYMLQLASQDEDSFPLAEVTLHFDVGGDYYEELKAAYNIEINERLWAQVRPGHVTINQ